MKITRYQGIMAHPFLTAILAIMFFAIFSSGASATTQTYLCSFIQDQLTKDLGKGIATLGVISVGVGAAFGRVTWSAAVLTAVGIAGLFGAASIADALNGPNAGGCW